MIGSLRAALAGLLVLLAASAGTDGKPLFLRGGKPHGTTSAGGVAQACDSGGSGVCAKFQSGQTFVTWNDMATGAAGNDWRYSVYRSNAPITAGNYASATLIASFVLNNSGQLVGGSPDAGGAAFTQTNRQSAVQPMAKLANLGTALPYGTGLQVYTARGSETAYYAVVGNSCPGGVCAGGGDTYIGSVGAIAESVADPAPVKYEDSSRQTYGKITTPAGKSVVFKAHASSGGGGAATNASWGDYWTWWLTPTEGWQDGRQIPLDVLQDTNLGHYPGLDHAIEVGTRDTYWNSLGTGWIETFWLGTGLTPNPLVGPANRLYTTTANGVSRMLKWVVSNYGTDPNSLHWVGTSMGAFGGAMVGMRMVDPKFATVSMTFPVWRYDLWGSGPSYWPGFTWASTSPFKATVHAAPQTLGTDPSAIVMAASSALGIADGMTFGGTGGFADMPSFIASNPGTDLPVAFWTISYDDVNLTASGAGSFQEELDALAAFQSAKRGHFFVWNMGAHDTSAMGAINCDAGGADAGVCYSKTQFNLNTPYLAFTGSSIDDNPGTATRNASGIMDGDNVGCVNCGFKWNITTDTAGAFNFTIHNDWMSRSPTASPQTTLTSSMASTGTASFTVTDGSVFASASSGINQYFLVGGTEIISVVNSGIAGNTITPLARGKFQTAAQAHSSGETIQQYISQPTGPNGGPFATMTVDITPRRRQGFLPANGATVTCAVTPNGGAPATINATVANGLFTLPAVAINDSGDTSVSCAF